MLDMLKYTCIYREITPIYLDYSLSVAKQPSIFGLLILGDVHTCLSSLAFSAFSGETLFKDVHIDSGSIVNHKANFVFGGFTSFSFACYI